MNQTFGDNTVENRGNGAADSEIQGRRPWVRPTLERLSLKDALTVKKAPFNDATKGAS